jgi:hypothetical protein
MQLPDPNPPLPPLLRGVAWFQAVVLLAAGGGLFFQSDTVAALWPWPLTPYDARFLGAVFLAALAALGTLLVYPRWAPARLLLPMSFVFTALVLLVSLIDRQRFQFERWPAYAWYVVYLALAVLAVYCLYRYGHLPSPVTYPTPPAWRRVLMVHAVAAGLYGLALFALPRWLTSFWPWEVDAFHGRLYSVVFTTLAVGALGLAHWAAPVERLSLGLACAVLGLFTLFGVFIANAGLRAVDWSAPGAWLWLLIFGLEFALGLALIGWSSNQKEIAR